MNNEPTEIDSENGPFLPSSSSPSSNTTVNLTKELRLLYKVMPGDAKRLFMRSFRWLWSHVNGKRVNLISSLWAVDLLRARLRLPLSHLVILSYLYHITDKGLNVVHSDTVYSAPLLPDFNQLSKQSILLLLKRAGYISRSTSDPSAPHLSRSYDRHPVFIKMTPAGVRLIEGMNKDINNMMMRTSLEVITGNKKSP